MQPHDPTPEATETTNGDLVTVTPGALAGPGEPGTALGILEDADWRFETNEWDNTRAWSPDGLVCVGFLPEHEPCHDTAALWVIEVYREAGICIPVWTATFDNSTPAELIAAFCRRLVETHTTGIRRNVSDDHTLLHPPYIS